MIEIITKNISLRHSYFDL